MENGNFILGIGSSYKSILFFLGKIRTNDEKRLKKSKRRDKIFIPLQRCIIRGYILSIIMIIIWSTFSFYVIWLIVLYWQLVSSLVVKFRRLTPWVLPFRPWVLSYVFLSTVVILWHSVQDIRWSDISCLFMFHWILVISSGL